MIGPLGGAGLPGGPGPLGSPGPGGPRRPDAGPAGRLSTDLMEALRSGQLTGEERKEAVARLVDSTFLEELFRALRSTVEDGGAMGAGEGAAGFIGMMDQTLAEAASHRMRLGFGARIMGSETPPPQGGTDG